jgi:hypothetical protein
MKSELFMDYFLVLFKFKTRYIQLEGTTVGLAAEKPWGQSKKYFTPKKKK